MTAFRLVLEDKGSPRFMKLYFYIVNLADGVCLGESILQCTNDVREEQQCERIVNKNVFKGWRH